jgi:putative transposase
MESLTQCLGAPSTVHDRFQQWVKAGVFQHLWESGLLQLHVERKLNWEFQSLDGCSTKAPLGGEAVGANPTDRQKAG